MSSDDNHIIEDYWWEQRIEDEKFRQDMERGVYYKCCLMPSDGPHFVNCKLS